MKKVLLLFLIGLFASCTKCSKPQEKADVMDSVATAKMNVENIISTDREDMFLNYAEDYRWFETCIVLQDFLDEECDGTVTGVSNVFQAVENREDGNVDTFVVLYAHTPDTAAVDVKHGFWVEDLPLNEELIVINFDSAFVRVMEANCPKPHSKQVVLRKQLGPVNCNPQYIFGNRQAQIYVDATTGEVNTTNPVFPEEQGFKMPLGEWP